jgi:molybdopterin synthase sulfur carrier subunit
MTSINLVYFAWVRERIGRGGETRDIPAGIETGRDLIDWLKSQGEEYAHAFEKPDTIRIAIDQTHADHDATIAGAREVAFFPPVTGG